MALIFQVNDNENIFDYFFADMCAQIVTFTVDNNSLQRVNFFLQS